MAEFINLRVENGFITMTQITESIKEKNMECDHVQIEESMAKCVINKSKGN
jgi:hypothetical protein